jgi:hypothetical protein
MEMDKYGAFVAVGFVSSETIVADITSNVNSSNGGDYDNAAQLVQNHIFVSKGQLDFQILSNIKTNMGQIEGNELILSFRFLNTVPDPHLPPGTVVLDKPQIERYFTMDHGDRIYDISFLGDADKYESVKGDFEHLITTFHFLD